MLRSVARLSRIAAATSLRWLFISTISALSIATSVPAPIAMPISARVSAGASLMPSPVIAVMPRSFNCRITASLPSGSTPAITSSTPAVLPIASAVRWLSPVNMTTSIPIFCSWLIASALSGRMTSATAITPRSVPSASNSSGVFPSSESCSICFCISPGTLQMPEMKDALPPWTIFRLIVA